MRHLIIVARGRPELFDEFSHLFQAGSALDILYDRRHHEPARAPRHPERRDDAEGKEAKLRRDGYIVVRAG